MALINKLKAIANAIRSKTNKNEELTLEQMASEVEGIDTLQGFDFGAIYDQEQANELNQYYKDGIAYAERIKAENPNPSRGWYEKFKNDNNLIFFPDINTSNITGFHSAFYGCLNLEYINTDASNCTSIYFIFYNCKSLKKVIITNISNITNATSAFGLCYRLRDVLLSGWKKTNILFTQTAELSPYSVHYIIQNATSLEDGATERTLTLNATAKTNWQNSEYYEQDLAVLEQKGITIA